MRRQLGALLALLMLSLGAVASEPPLGDQGARLLLTRAGFAPADADVSTYSRLTHRAAVDRLLAGALDDSRDPASGVGR